MILIDMDMPKNCADCHCTYDDFSGETRCVLGSPDIDWNERPCTCPMIKADGLEDAIDRRALRVQFNHLDEVYEGMSEEEEHEAYIYGQIIRAIDDAPSVTPKPRTGKWIKHNTGHSVYYDCSLCGCAAPCTETADKILWKMANYCYDCGAKMEGESE